MDTEKDALLERFFAFARHACAALRDQGHWADYIDPCSGLPVRHCATRLFSRSAFGCLRRFFSLALGYVASSCCSACVSGAVCAPAQHHALTWRCCVAVFAAQMVHKEGPGVYGEVDALVTLLGYATANAGCCKVALHPRWGSAFYPASLLTKAPLDATTKALADAAAALEQQLA